MKLENIVIVLSALFLQIILTQSHKHGAPNKSCHSLLPHHKHISYRETSAEIKTFVVDGNNINVDLQSEKHFKGM